MENIDKYSYICEVDGLKSSEGNRFYINDVDIAVFKIDQKIFIVSNICPHQQASAIHEGFVENESVICPLHGWTFKLCDGRIHNGGKGLDAFPSKIVDGKLYGKIEPKILIGNSIISLSNYNIVRHNPNLIIIKIS